MTPEIITGRAILKGAVQQAMFCTSCTKCLDQKSAVEVTASAKGQKQTVVICAGCYDEKVVPAIEAKAKMGITITALDGRTLWGKRSAA